MIIDEDTIYVLVREAREAGITDGILLSKFLAKALTSLGAKQEWERIVKAENDCIKDRAVFIASYNARRERLEGEMANLRKLCPHTEVTPTATPGHRTGPYCKACKGAVK